MQLTAVSTQLMSSHMAALPGDDDNDNDKEEADGDDEDD